MDNWPFTVAGIAPYLNIYALVAGMVGVRYAYISNIGFVISIALLSQSILIIEPKITKMGKF